MITRLLALLFAVCFAGAAQAQTVAWSSPGTACIPSDVTTKLDSLKDGNASVQHATGKIDPVALTCAIPRFNVGTTIWQLRMVYQDSTGTNTAAFVRARIYQMPLASITPVLLATVISNNSNATTAAILRSPNFTHTFDFENNAYWVRVDLARTATSQLVVFHSVTLVAGSVASDRRLKHDVVLLGHLDNGLGLYRFAYNGSDAAYVGVMAQEVQTLMPDAVMRGEDGFLRVYYDRLGLRMQTWEDWVAAGEKIPGTAALMRQ